MGFLRRWLSGGGADQGVQADPEGGPAVELPPTSDAGPVTDGNPSLHRVVVWVRLEDPSFERTREQQRLFALENTLMRAVFEAGAGDLDTNELGRGFLALRFQGVDADAIVGVLVPRCGGLPTGSYLAVRRGPTGTAEDRVDLPGEVAAA